MKLIRYELKRAFDSLGMKISIMIGVLICVMDLNSFYNTYKNSGILVQAWLGTDYLFAYNRLFYILLPLIACLPYAGSYYTDINSGYDKNICIRASRINYFIAKCSAVYISAFTAVTFPLALSLFLCAGIYPNYKPERLEFITPGILDSQMFAELFQNRPLLYCLLFILIDGIYGGLMGLISVCFSRWAANKFSAIMMPFIIYILSGTMLAFGDGYNYGIMEMLCPTQIYISDVGYMTVLYLCLFVICISVAYLWSGRRNVI